MASATNPVRDTLSAIDNNDLEAPFLQEQEDRTDLAGRIAINAAPQPQAINQNPWTCGRVCSIVSGALAGGACITLVVVAILYPDSFNTGQLVGH